MQVLPCSKRFCHDWTVCPYAHPGEKAKRRDPRVHSYTGIACPNMKKVGSQLLSSVQGRAPTTATSCQAWSAICLAVWDVRGANPVTSSVLTQLCISFAGSGVRERRQLPICSQCV